MPDLSSFISNQLSNLASNVQSAANSMPAGDASVGNGYQGSQQQLNDIKNEFDAEQQRKLDTSRLLNQSDYLASFNGTNPFANPYAMQTLESIRNDNEINPVQAERMRRLGPGDGTFSLNPLDWDPVGLTSQDKTPDGAKGLYDYNFKKEDDAGIRNEDAISTKLTGEKWVAPGMSTIAPVYNGSQAGNIVPSEKRKIVDENAIDDGADPGSRNALYMTGEQYYKYRTQFGIPGRPVKDIENDPNVLYSKQDEQDKYGFIPYLEDDDDVFRFKAASTAPAVSNAFNYLADARRNIFDYTIDYDGMQLSGRDFNKNRAIWDKNNARKGKPAPIYDESQVGEYDVPQKLVAYDDQGNKHVATEYAIGEEVDDLGRTHIIFDYNDRSKDWIFQDADDLEKNFRLEDAEEGDLVQAWLPIDPLVLDDGTKIRADKAYDIFKNMDSYSDYGPLNIAKPNADDPFKDGFVPWFTDMALSSSPYFVNPLAVAKSAGDSLNSWNGFKPGYQNYLTGTYQLLSEDPNEMERLTSTSGSIALPWTERLWGPFGKVLFKKGPTEKLLDALHVPARASAHPAVQVGTNASDEGIEEIFGNIIEEFQRNGTNWYANDAMRRNNLGDVELDMEGNPIPDSDRQGRAKKVDSNAAERILNFIKDIPMAYFGGASLGGILGLKDVGNYIGDYMALKDEYDKFGDNASYPVDVDALLSVAPMSDSERHYYDSGIRR